MSNEERQRLLLVDRNTDPPTALLECYTPWQVGDVVNMSPNGGGVIVTHVRDDIETVVGRWVDVTNREPSYALLVPPRGAGGEQP